MPYLNTTFLRSIKVYNINSMAEFVTFCEGKTFEEIHTTLKRALAGKRKKEVKESLLRYYIYRYCNGVIKKHEIPYEEKCAPKDKSDRPKRIKNLGRKELCSLTLKSFPRRGAELSIRDILKRL